MEKNKKIILIIVAAIVVIAVVVGIVYGITKNIDSKEEKVIEDTSASKVNKLYEKLEEKKEYSFAGTVDKENKIYYAKKEDVAYVETTFQGNTSKIIIKDGNTYLIMDDRKGYYAYTNNETDLNKVLNQLDEIRNLECKVGKEKVDNKEYKYEEYAGKAEFLMKNIDGPEQENATTKLYFKGDNLEYIKTIVGDYQELLKVDISYSPDAKLFEIPEGYEEL